MRSEGILTRPNDSPKRTSLDEAAREDAELVRRTLAGDRNAFEDLVRKYHHPLLRLLKGITRNTQDAEDLVQDAFLRAFRNLDRYDPARPFRPWLWTLGTRLALHLIARKERKNVSLETAATNPDEEGRTDGPWLGSIADLDRMEGSLLQRALVEALETLEPHHRAVMVLRVFEERSYEEIAEILEVPQGTVMSRINRARARLRDKLRGWTPQGEINEPSM